MIIVDNIWRIFDTSDDVTVYAVSQDRVIWGESSSSRCSQPRLFF